MVANALPVRRFSGPGYPHTDRAWTPLAILAKLKGGRDFRRTSVASDDLLTLDAR
jgi:hypothetical protein